MTSCAGSRAPGRPRRTPLTQSWPGGGGSPGAAVSPPPPAPRVGGAGRAQVQAGGQVLPAGLLRPLRLPGGEAGPGAPGWAVGGPLPAAFGVGGDQPCSGLSCLLSRRAVTPVPAPQLLSPSNVAVYGGLCALATFDRQELQRNVISSRWGCRPCVPGHRPLGCRAPCPWTPSSGGAG